MNYLPDQAISSGNNASSSTIEEESFTTTATTVDHNTTTTESRDDCDEALDNSKREQLIGTANINNSTLLIPKPNEDYTPAENNNRNANQLKFWYLCVLLEDVWRNKHQSAVLTTKNSSSNSNRKAKQQRRAKYTQHEKLGKLLSNNLHRSLDGGSPYNYLRLLVPNVDISRGNFNIKEKAIAAIWSRAMGLSKQSLAFQKLERYHDPTKAGVTAVGDLSMAIREVMEERGYSKNFRKSTVTIGHVNELLDELVRIGTAQYNSENDTQSSGNTKRSRQIEWVEKILRMSFSTLEHKWLVRIILRHLNMGLTDDSIIDYYNPRARAVFNADRNLKRLCAKLSDPEWLLRHALRDEARKKVMRMAYMPKWNEDISIGNDIQPMLCQRTSFQTALSDVVDRHQKFAGDSADKADYLALKFPAFLTEVKFDGERVLAHVSNGVVSLQSRNIVWYTQAYRPIIGPGLRRAMKGYDVNVILDGEVIAWDNRKKNTIPFGSNRPVAKARRDWLASNNLIEGIDSYHIDDEKRDAGTIAVAQTGKQQRLDGNNEGQHVWLKFIIFDIIYIDGPDAKHLMRNALTPFYRDASSHELEQIIHTGGSILDIDLHQRKQLLYTLITPQINEVELADALVIRPDGTSIKANDYFCKCDDDGRQFAVVDSINCALDKVIADISEIDTIRRRNRKDSEIEQCRAVALDKYYTEIVENQNQEGLVMKDLASPYVLGNVGRSYGYWRKFKADYEQVGNAADIDVAIIGGFYASGMKRAGLISHFLVGIVDSIDAQVERMDGGAATSTKFLTLGKISGGGTKRINLDEMLAHTKFKKATESSPMEYGKWFQSDSPPDFISSRSFQRTLEGDDLGWKCSTKEENWPDVWIQPIDSFVLTINAAEIVLSPRHSAGVSTRFARIQGNPRYDKPCHEVDTVETLHRLYHECSRSSTTTMTNDDAPRQQLDDKKNGDVRFLTKFQKTKPKTQLRKEPVMQFICSKILPVEVKSNAFSGMSFAILDGKYKLDERSWEATELQNTELFPEILKVSSRNGVILFVRENGGSVDAAAGPNTDFVVGGCATDARVRHYRNGMESVNGVALNVTTKSGRKAYTFRTLNVVKWIFVWKMLQKFRDESSGRRIKSEDEEVRSCKDFLSIKSAFPHIANPRLHDYLVASRATEEDLMVMKMDDVSRSSNPFELREMLNKISQKRRQYRQMKKKSPLHVKAKQIKVEEAQTVERDPFLLFPPLGLDGDERWILRGKRRKLYYCTPRAAVVGSSNKVVRWRIALDRQVVVYVDIESNADDCDGGVNFEKEKIASVVPLVRAMGAEVCTSLHHDGQITHILTSLGGSSGSFSLKNLPAHLLDILQPKISRWCNILGSSGRDICFISNEWIRRTWNESEYEA